MGGAVKDFVMNPITHVVRAGADAALSPLTEEQRKAREQAERLAAQQREALAKLQAEAATAIPIADEVAKAARRRSITSQLRRRGRASTILTGQGGPGDALGA